jgi:hypothetical protein
MRLYYETQRHPWTLQQGERVVVPSAMAVFPKEISRPPRAWASGPSTFNAGPRCRAAASPYPTKKREALRRVWPILRRIIAISIKRSRSFLHERGRYPDLGDSVSCQRTRWRMPDDLKMSGPSSPLRRFGNRPAAWESLTEDAAGTPESHGRCGCRRRRRHYSA